MNVVIQMRILIIYHGHFIKREEQEEPGVDAKSASTKISTNFVLWNALLIITLRCLDF